MLQEDEKNRLIEAAKKAKDSAYAPYSNFHVGAAVMTQSGDIYCGCNVENASYGLTLCAERVAICNAVAAGHTNIKYLLFISDMDEFKGPCGACRQAISEFSDEKTILISTKRSGETKLLKMDELLPMAFKKSQLNIK